MPCKLIIGLLWISSCGYIIDSSPRKNKSVDNNKSIPIEIFIKHHDVLEKIRTHNNWLVYFKINGEKE